MSEPRADQLARLRLMAAGDEKWDLSSNDRAAIAAVVEENADLRRLLAEADAWTLHAERCACGPCTCGLTAWRERVEEALK